MGEVSELESLPALAAADQADGDTFDRERCFFRIDDDRRELWIFGDENDLRLRVYGDAASLEWRQQEPNSLWLKHAHKPVELVRSGGAGLGAAAHANSRLPSGHPEGYLEAFANVYRHFAAQVRAHGGNGNGGGPAPRAVPGITAALRGMAFIETVVAASQSQQKWHAFPAVAD